MKMIPLLSREGKDDGFRIHPAGNEDWPAIERLLVYADRQYTALEWWSIQEWLGSPTFLLLRDHRERCLGLMLTVVGKAPIGWIRALIVASEKYVAPLLRASLEIAAEEEASGLAFLGSERWVLSRLRQADFQQVNRVITLCNRGEWKIREGPSDLKVRLATRADSDDVLAVDRAAFAPMWWYSRAVFARALSLAYCFDVAYMDDACVGYQLSTFRRGRGHIVRLAVHPLWQHRGIGGRLLSEALQSLDEAGAHSITVNTQEDNRASLQLYDRFNFRRVGKPWEVWFRSLEPK